MEFIRGHAGHRQCKGDGGLVWGVEPICTVLSEHGLPIAPSTYYAQVNKPATGRERRDALLVNEIRRVHAANYGVYGARKVWLALNREGIAVARCTVERLMRQEGLAGAVRGKVKRTTIADPAGPRARDLVRRDFAPLAPDRLWVADITYVSTWSGWVYVAFVTDAFARRIIGWRCGSSMGTQLVLDALEQAVWTRQRDGRSLDTVVAHTDRGSQYTAIRYTERLAEAGIAASVGSVGSSYDNALARDHQRPVQDRAHQATRPVAHPRHRRDRHRRMGRLVQPPPPLRVLRRHPARRPRARLLRSDPGPADR